MNQAVIIGYGNPLRRDDGIGWRAAELAEAELRDAGVEVVRTHQLTPELALKLEHAETVVFLDAAEGDAPGFLRFQFVDAAESDAWTHDLSPGQLLRLAYRLYGFEPAAFLITGGAQTTDHGEGLSEVAERCAVRMAALAAALAAPNITRVAAQPSDLLASRAAREYSRPIA